jgi:hypothetical protein
MSRSIKKVSSMCVRALVDGGEMSKAQADRLRKPTTSKHVTHKRTYHKRTTKKRTTKR